MNLAETYLQGKGVEINQNEAFNYFSIVANSGFLYG